MKILVACEFSGIVSQEFRKLGHNVTSCDLIPSVSHGDHYLGDVLDILGDGWDMMVAFPPCTYLCASGMHWTVRGYRDPQLTEDAVEFVQVLMNADIPKICIENPIGVLSSRIRKPDQIIQPYQFGHNVSKSTCLWLKGLPLLQPTEFVEPVIVNGKKRWGNQTPSGGDRTGPSDDRGLKRSITYSGIASAMANQWGTEK